jgi:hypothetical protein
LIVVGSHGPRSSSLGSISAKVSRRAPCPVVVVPPGADEGFHGDGSADGVARFESGASDRPARRTAADAERCERKPGDVYWLERDQLAKAETLTDVGVTQVVVWSTPPAEPD